MAEEKQRRVENEQLLRFTQYAIDNLSDAAFWFREDGRPVYVNKEACRSLGYTEQELLSLPIHVFGPSATKERWAGFWNQIKTAGEVIFEAAVTRLVELAAEWRAWPMAERRDFHERSVQSHVRW